jgi:hypothetical protein
MPDCCCSPDSEVQQAQADLSPSLPAEQVLRVSVDPIGGILVPDAIAAERGTPGSTPAIATHVACHAPPLFISHASFLL